MGTVEVGDDSRSCVRTHRTRQVQVRGRGFFGDRHTILEHIPRVVDERRHGVCSLDVVPVAVGVNQNKKPVPKLIRIVGRLSHDRPRGTNDHSPRRTLIKSGERPQKRRRVNARGIPRSCNRDERPGRRDPRRGAAALPGHDPRARGGTYSVDGRCTRRDPRPGVRGMPEIRVTTMISIVGGRFR